MKVKFIFYFLFFVLTSNVLFGQTANIKTSVKFDNNKHKLRTDAKQVIDETVDTLLIENIAKVTVVGHTDNTADSLYNVKLSDKRAQVVKDYLISKGFDAKIIQTNYFGMDKPIASNENEDGKQKNRRVDIVFYYNSINQNLKSKSNSPQTAKLRKDDMQNEIDADASKEDTTIVLPQGTHIVLNRAEYLELKDCLEFTEANNSLEILKNGLSLMAENGTPLTSCGMIRIKLKTNCTDKTCLKYPIKVQFPVPEIPECDYCKRNASVWNITTNGWRGTNNNIIKIIKKDKKNFYQFEIKCPSKEWMNCDCKAPAGRKRKFKIKRPYEIVNIKIAFDCPTVVLNLTPERRKNVVKYKIPCISGEKTVTATIVNKQGDTLLLEQQPLNNLPKRTLFPRCYRTEEKVIIGKRLWIFPVYQREMYRKYIIKPEMLKPKNTQ
jgi:hypothetical protein